ncbi:MAG: hypothetical protein JNJ83_15560 [Verrucomicrobiaceae bacterium]|nr:hypothetical protein [Verrucomicrobiaceae bacterium]
MADKRIIGQAIITEVLGDRTYHARLPNGKVIFAFFPSHRNEPQLAIGADVQVALSLYDFSEGEIVGIESLCSVGSCGETEAN